MRSLQTLSLLLLPLLCACSGSELVGVYVALAADGTGTVTVRSLVTAQPGQAESRTTGARWTIHAALVASQGSFEKIADLKLGDGGLQFTPQLDGDRPGMRVRLQRGPDAPWIQALVPDQATRRLMAKAYDPSGRNKEIADVLRIEIAAPSDIITSGVLPGGRGVEAGKENKRAFLLLPVRTAIEAGDDFVWEIGWLRSN